MPPKKERASPSLAMLFSLFDPVSAFGQLIEPKFITMRCISSIVFNGCQQIIYIRIVPFQIWPAFDFFSSVNSRHKVTGFLSGLFEFLIQIFSPDHEHFYFRRRQYIVHGESLSIQLPQIEFFSSRINNTQNDNIFREISIQKGAFDFTRLPDPCRCLINDLIPVKNQAILIEQSIQNYFFCSSFTDTKHVTIFLILRI